VSSLRAAWEENAQAFIAWARKPGHDTYWRFHRDAFLALLPSPGRKTLDLGCGEGRLSRDLAALGHTIVGIDASPTMLGAAREAAPEIETHLADAAALPFPDGAFDCVIAFMSLQDVDDLEGALRESARVLEPGGRLCVAIVHPINSAGAFESDDPASRFVIAGRSAHRVAARAGGARRRDGRAALAALAARSAVSACARGQAGVRHRQSRTPRRGCS
jgi:SAM-dependent methyltransferase